MIPKFNQLTQSIHDDGKGGYIIKDLPKEKAVIEEVQTESPPVILRGEEKSVLAELKAIREENIELKTRLAKIEQTDTVKTELTVKEPIIKR